jgi:pyruvate/2-oxoglutarate/acetoin dehydrogenase E1 component
VLLQETGIDAEVVDVQTLLPFDRPGLVGQSLQKTGRIIFFDEDVPGGERFPMLFADTEYPNRYILG